jgi:MFS family permease
VRGFSPLDASAAFLPYALIPLVGPAAARLVPRLGPAGLTGLGLGVAAVGLGLLARLTPNTAYAPLLLVALVIYAIGAGHAFSGATVAVLEDTPAHQAGLAGGVLNTAMEVGPTVGLALLLSLAALRTSRLTGAGADVASAVTGGYAFALGAAALAYLVVAALCVFALRRGSPRTTG